MDDDRDRWERLEAAKRRLGDAVRGLMMSLDEKPTETIWHYTTTEGLRGILANRGVWATQHKHLNDPTEVSLGREVIGRMAEDIRSTGQRSVVDRLRVHGGDEYIACFSGDGDDLMQWVHYGDRGRGVAVGFDPSRIKFPVRRVSYNVSEFEARVQQTMLAIDGLWVHIGYDSEIYDSEQEFDEHATTLLGGILEWACQLKHSAYAHEKEWRIRVPGLKLATGDVPEELLGPRLRVRGTDIVPYMPMQLWTKSDEEAPIVEIRLGPCLDPRNGERLVRMLWREYQVAGACPPVCSSKIPYRG